MEFIYIVINDEIYFIKLLQDQVLCNIAFFNLIKNYLRLLMLKCRKSFLKSK